LVWICMSGFAMIFYYIVILGFFTYLEERKATFNSSSLQMYWYEVMRLQNVMDAFCWAVWMQKLLQYKDQ
jgi:hypothetical protein